MKGIKKVVDWIVSIEKKVCVTLLVIMVIVNFAQVIFRYVFNRPFGWSEEIILTLLIWFGFICMSIDIANDSHVAITGIYEKFASGMKKFADMARHGLLAIFFGLMAKYGYQFLMVSMRKKMPASRISQGWQSAPLLIGGVIMSLFCIINLISVLIKEEDQKEIGEERQ
ncbi:TRAP transporter small permease [Fusobacterium sp. PH5-44]|uniref:TRAP transporter small permease n=1 Tax=unclassified Fusobacterium TaxID=2648384 RepID=UPI003D24AB5B